MLYTMLPTAADPVASFVSCAALSVPLLSVVTSCDRVLKALAVPAFATVN